MYKEQHILQSQRSNPLLQQTEQISQPAMICLQTPESGNGSQSFDVVIEDSPGKSVPTFKLIPRTVGSESQIISQNTKSVAVKSDRSLLLPVPIGRTETDKQNSSDRKTCPAKGGESRSLLSNMQPVKILPKPVMPLNYQRPLPRDGNCTTEQSVTSVMSNTAAMSLLKSLLKKKSTETAKHRLKQVLILKRAKLKPSSPITPVMLKMPAVKVGRPSGGLTDLLLPVGETSANCRIEMNRGCNACPPFDHNYAKCLNCPPRETSPETPQDVICIDDDNDDNDTNNVCDSPVFESSNRVEEYSTSFTTSEKGEQVMVVNPTLFNFEEQESTQNQNRNADTFQTVKSSFDSINNIKIENSKWKETDLMPTPTPQGEFSNKNVFEQGNPESSSSSNFTEVEIDSSCDWKIDSVYSLAPEINQFDVDVNDIEIDYADEETDDADEGPENEQSEECVSFSLRGSEWKEFCQPCFVVLERLPISKGMKLQHDDIISKCSPHCRHRTLRLLCGMNLLKCCNHPLFEIHENKGPVHQHKKPVVKNKNPTLENHGPISENEDPVIENEDPVFENEDPVIENEGPVSENENILFDNRDTEFENRDTEFENRDTEFENRDTEFENRDTEFENRDTDFENRDTEFENRDTEFENRDTEFENRDTEFENRATEFEYRDTEFENGGLVFENKDPVLIKKEVTVEKENIYLQPSPFQSCKNDEAETMCTEESPVLLSSPAGSGTNLSQVLSKSKEQTPTGRSNHEKRKVLTFEKALARLKKQVASKRKKMRLMKKLRAHHRPSKSRHPMPTINGVPVDPIRFAQTCSFSITKEKFVEKNWKGEKNSHPSSSSIPHKIFSVSNRETQMRLIPSSTARPVPNNKLQAAMDALAKFIKSNPQITKKNCCYFMVTIEDQQILIKTSPYSSTSTSSSHQSANVSTSPPYLPANVSTSSSYQPAKVSSSPYQPASVSTSSPYQPANDSTTSREKNSTLLSLLNNKLTPGCSRYSVAVPSTHLRIGDNLTQSYSPQQISQTSASNLIQPRQKYISTLTMTMPPQNKTSLLSCTSQKEQTLSSTNASHIKEPYLPSSDSTKVSSSNTNNCLSQTQVKPKRPPHKHLTEEEKRIKRRKLEAKYPLPPGVIIKSEPITVGYEIDSSWSITSEIDTDLIPQDSFEGLISPIVAEEDDIRNHGGLSKDCDDSPPMLEMEDTMIWSTQEDQRLRISEDDVVETPPILQPMAPQTSFKDVIEVEDDTTENSYSRHIVDKSVVSPALESGYDSLSASSSSDTLISSSSTSSLDTGDERGQKSSQVRSRIQQLKELLKKKEIQVDNLRKVVSAFPQIDLDSI